MVSRNRLILAAFLSLASFAASINLVFAALVRMGWEFNVRPEVMASISSIYFAGFFFVSVASGFVSDRYGAKVSLLFGNLLTLTGGVIFASAHGAASLVAGAIAMGMGGGATEGMCSALLARLFPGRERFVVNLSQAGYCLGAIAGPFLMGIFVPRGVNWRVFFFPMAALALTNFVLFAGSRFPPAERVTDSSSGSEPPARALSEALGVLRRPSVVRWCAVVFLYVLAEQSLAGFVNIYLFEFRNAPEGVAIQAIAAFWGVMLVGRLLCGVLPSRLADRKLISLGMGLGAASTLLVLGAAGWGGALLSLLVTSFFIAGAWPTAVALVAAQNSDRASTVVGVTVAVGALGCIVAPPAMGLLFGAMPPAVAMAAPALPLLAGSLLALYVPRGAPEGRRASATQVW